MVVVVVVVVGATETLATALVGYSVTVFTSSENCLARPGEARETFNIKFIIYIRITQISDKPVYLTSTYLADIVWECRDLDNDGYLAQIQLRVNFHKMHHLVQ